MASLQCRNDAYRLIFRFGGKQHAFSVGKVSPAEARQWKAKAEHLLMRLEQRLLTLPAGVTIADFVRHDGNPPTPKQLAEEQRVSLSDLRSAYVEAHARGGIEKNTLYTNQIHLRHVEDTLGKTFLLAALTRGKLQDHVNRRQADVAPTTIKKELDTFRAAWNWGMRMGLVTAPFPSGGLVYPKSEEKLPFMSWEEIERRVKAGGDADALWDCLYLRPAEVDAFLGFAKAESTHDWLYPFLFTAAYTGARRSELMGARVEDADFEEICLTLREKKRARGVRTTRRVPMSAKLLELLKPLSMSKVEAGKPYLFGPGDEPIPVSETQKAWYGTFKGSKWEVVRGYHCLRHSFISACAAKGVDQRMLQEWVGHQSPEMSRRYTHLYPSAQQDAIASVFA